MEMNERTVVHGRADVFGTASGELLFSTVELSFWGGVDHATGEVIDRHHPLSGQYLQDCVLAIPGGRGSCGGSTVMMELIYNGKGPRAIIFERREEIITLGVMLSEEIFGQSIPVLRLKREGFLQLQRLNGRTVHVVNSSVSDGDIDVSPDFVRSGNLSNGERLLSTQIKLNTSDQEFLDGVHGEAGRIAMRVLLRLASLMEAEELIDVAQVHLDACLYVGPASVAVPRKLHDLGGRVQVLTTMNAISVDKQRWRALGVDASFGESSDAIANAYVEMGARPTFTCAPYQLESAPREGELVGWGESNAVVYANSVLGARTMKYPDFLDVAVALTGRAPKAGVYLDHNRKASLLVRMPAMINDFDESFWPLLGYAIGNLAGSQIPVLTGLETLAPSKDDLKAFGAAFATSCSAPMFHMVGITPEASSVAVVTSDLIVLQYLDFDLKALTSCWREFSPVEAGQKVDLVSLGNPHLSLSEIRRLAELCRDRTKHTEVELVVTCGRSVYGLGQQAGLVEPLERFGVKFLTDTCWCFITEPIIPKSAHIIMTNSGKYAHYGPGLTGRQFCFGSLAMCVEVACKSVIKEEIPHWLRNINT